MNRLRLTVALLALMVASCRASLPAVVPPAVPVDPIEGILQALRTNDIVALGDGAHGNEQGHAVRMGLVRDDRVAEVLDDIVVEFGNARYQDVIDRFVRGDNVPEAELRQVWQNTTQAHSVWDVPVFEEFFRAVRDANAARAGRRQLRVLLGDPPVDWGRIKTPQDLRAQLDTPEADRDAHATEVIRRNVVAKGHKAVAIYGNMHLVRHDPFGEPNGSLVARLEKAGVPRPFTVWTSTAGGDIATLQPDVTSWRRPSMAALKGSPLGAADFGFYYPHQMFVNGQAVRASPGIRMEDQFDALLYLGPHSTITFSELPRARCEDPEYMRMRLSRMALFPRFPDGGDPAQPLRDYCSRVLSK